MTDVLITGATGNVGLAVIHSLSNVESHLNIYAGLKNPELTTEKLLKYAVKKVKFDFTDISTFNSALNNCDILFLLRPPQISDVKKYFKPLVLCAKEKEVKHIIFLSVQGANKSTIIPHHKIEKLIIDSNIPYTFLRPAYFMQNFTTTLRDELVRKKRIFLPAGNVKFTLIDVGDIGNVAAIVITNAAQHVNKAYELTNNEKLTFREMAASLSNGLGETIHFISPGLFQFYLEKRKEKVAIPFIFVMIMLHYFPRFQKEPPISDWVKQITLKQPISFEQFIENNKKTLIS